MPEGIERFQKGSNDSGPDSTRRGGESLQAGWLAGGRKVVLAKAPNREKFVSFEAPSVLLPLAYDIQYEEGFEG